MTRNKHIWWFLGISMVMMLASGLIVSCGQEHGIRDLQKFVEDTKKEKSMEKLAPSKELPALTSITYTGNGFRAPFATTTAIAVNNTNKEVEANPLVGYALSTLRFIGTVKQSNNIFAYILAPDNKVYQVGLGDEVGDQHGIVIGIKPNQLQMKERSKRGPGIVESIITLELKEKD